MKKYLMFLCAVTLVFGMMGSARAFTFDMGANSSVDTSGTNSALSMFANVNVALDSIGYTLNAGESSSFLFAEIGTTEAWINGDDTTPGAVTANIDFDLPSLIQPVGGTSVGFSGFLAFNQGWNLTWNDPVLVDFGTGGQFQIELEDVGASTFWWQGPASSAYVNATVTLLSEPVPEPATVVLLGIGLAGLAGGAARRKWKKKAAADNS
jgi:PEP-CTERM putative exosortase interaction domain